MRVFAFEHDGVYLYGYSVVVAETEEEAKQLMRDALLEMKLDPKRVYNIHEVNLEEKKVIVLWDGDY